jgi:hypothetical protein
LFYGRYRDKKVGVFCFSLGFQAFSAESIWQNKFESKQAGLTFEFNESLSGFEMLVPDGKKIQG